MSDPIDPRENPSKRKFDELPDQVTSTDHPRNKRYGSLRLEFMISCYQILNKYQPKARLYPTYLYNSIIKHRYSGNSHGSQQ